MYLSSDTPADPIRFDPPAKPAIGPWLVDRVIRHIECGRMTVVMPSGARVRGGTLAV